MNFEPKLAWVAVKELAGGDNGHHENLNAWQ